MVIPMTGVAPAEETDAELILMMKMPQAAVPVTILLYRSRLTGQQRRTTRDRMNGRSSQQALNISMSKENQLMLLSPQTWKQ